MKKSIATVALLVSASSAHALVRPRPGHDLPVDPVQTKTVCLAVYGAEADGSQNAGSCDQSLRNQMYSRELKQNGCAEGQVAIKETTLEVPSCPVAVQL
jgi:hypothetical protein